MKTYPSINRKNGPKCGSDASVAFPVTLASGLGYCLFLFKVITQSQGQSHGGGKASSQLNYSQNLKSSSLGPARLWVFLACPKCCCPSGTGVFAVWLSGHCMYCVKWVTWNLAPQVHRGREVFPAVSGAPTSLELVTRAIEVMRKNQRLMMFKWNSRIRVKLGAYWNVVDAVCSQEGWKKNTETLESSW